MWLPRFLKGKKAHEPPKYESLEEALRDLKIEDKPLGTSLGLSLPPGLNLPRGIIIIPMDYRINYALRNDCIEMVAEVSVGISLDLEVAEAYQEIRADGNKIFVSITSKLKKKILLSKTVGYLAGGKAYYPQLRNKAVVERLRPLSEALCLSYFLQEMLKMAPEGSQPYHFQTEKLEELEATVKGFEQFVPIRT